MKHAIWSENYRPNKVADCILPVAYKEKFQSFVDAKFVPNLILAGPSGIGKTTVARAMLEELGFEYILINASLYGIDTLRATVQQFVTSMSFEGTRKYVVLDEADGMSRGFQEGLRAFIQEYSSNAGFVLTCNYPDKIIDAIHSRCELVDIVIVKDDFQPLAREFMNKLVEILRLEGVEYNKAVVVEVLKKTFPDFRKGIDNLQSYSLKGKIDTASLSSPRTAQMDKLIDLLRNKKWSEMRDWVGENFVYLGEFAAFAEEFYNSVRGLVTAASLPFLVELTNEHDYKNAFVIDKEVNIAAFLTKVMAEVTFK